MKYFTGMNVSDIQICRTMAPRQGKAVCIALFTADWMPNQQVIVVCALGLAGYYLAYQYRALAV